MIISLVFLVISSSSCLRSTLKLFSASIGRGITFPPAKLTTEAYVGNPGLGTITSSPGFIVAKNNNLQTIMGGIIMENISNIITDETRIPEISDVAYVYASFDIGPNVVQTGPNTLR